jgi:hypothetical protein
MKTARRVLAAALVLCLTGARPADPDVITTVGACTLVTQDEASTALGAPVPAGAEKAMNLPLQGANIEAQYCFYGTEVIIARLELGPKAPSVFDQYRLSLSSESGYRSVKGVGDEAFIAKGQLAARRGTTGLIIDVGQARGGGLKEEEAEKTLAVHAVGRL